MTAQAPAPSPSVPAGNPERREPTMAEALQFARDWAELQRRRWLDEDPPDEWGQAGRS
jgi:hypothetical protein